MDTPPHLVHVTLDSDGRLDSLTISALWREKLGGSGPRLSAEVLMAVWRATPWPSQPSIRSFEPGWMANAGALARGDFVDRAVRALDAAMAGAGQSTTRELTTDRGEIRGTAIGNRLVSLEFEPAWLKRASLRSLGDRLREFLEQVLGGDPADTADPVMRDGSELVAEMYDILSARR